MKQKPNKISLGYRFFVQLIEEDERKRIMGILEFCEFFDGIKQQIIPFNAEF